MLMTDGASDILLRLLAAAALGGLVGLERDIHGRDAGLRTHLLVSLGSAVFMVLSITVARSAAGGTFVSDPGRIAAQVVTGIGFLGAGVILKEGATVRGLTTAACLWLVAAIGLAAGAGDYMLAAMTTGIGLVGLIVLKAFERLYRKDYYRTLEITTDIGVEAGRVIDLVKKQDLTLLFCDIQRDHQAGLAHLTMGLRFFHKGITDKRSHGIIQALEKAGLELRSVTWRRS
jgi:putative Mg2+ transporter-C (MgtC) family protein